MKNQRSLRLLAVSALFFLGGCVGGSRTVLYQLTPLREKILTKDFSRLLWEEQIPDEQPRKMTTILRTDFFTTHLLQLRGSEDPHKHEFHDLILEVKSGVGYIFMGQSYERLYEGSIIFVPHGIPYYLVSTGPKPLAALATFAPPFDGKDSASVDKTEMQPRRLDGR